MGEHWDYYLCTDETCGNDFEAKRNPRTCDLCGAPVTKRPSDNHYYDFKIGAWVEAVDEDDDDE